MRLPSLLLALAVLSTCGDAAPRGLPTDGWPPLGWVDVRLVTAPAVAVGADGPWRALGPELALQGGSLPAETPLTLVEGRLRLGALDLGPPPVLLQPEEGTLLSCEGRRYRGSLRLEVGARGDEDVPRVVNRLPVDDYLKGVLPAEMPARFGLEALKAQAVAARSYALREAERRGWLHPDVRSQAYEGVAVEGWITNRAVEQTAGQVLARDGQVLPAWFHSCCGGVTAPASQVFDDPPEGVMDRPVSCRDCRRSPTWAWERRIPEERVCGAAGLPPPLQQVDVAPRRFPGRPETITIRAGGEAATLRVVDFRARVSAGLPWDEQLLSTCWRGAPRLEDGALIVQGGGWGHGVGLCQHGAAGYAERGASYRTILRRYYPGAELVRLK